jgi:hypothetical protein
MQTKRGAYLTATIVGTALFALAGCGHQDKKSEAAPQPASPSVAGQSEPALLAEEYVEGEATVLAVNHGARTITLSNERGAATTVKVPADVDLNRLKVGDTVVIGILQSLSARVLAPGSAPVSTTVATGSTPPGQASGRAWGQQVNVIAEVTAIDMAAHTVTLRGVEGSRTIRVKDPEMQQRMANLKVGDLVELAYSEALAARVLPKS